MMFAMTEDPDTLMRKGLLLKDLRYRFGECGIAIPSLRERRAEIPLLAQRALQHCAERTKIDGPTQLSEAALALLCKGEYEGNVRELEGIVLSAYLIARHRGACAIAVEDLPPQFATGLRYQRHGDVEANRQVVQRVLRVTGGNAKKAAELLGVSRTTVNAVRCSTPERCVAATS
jgi:DNA-binding NtrC family response regulator